LTLKRRSKSLHQIEMELISGLAELFGTEVTKGHRYVFNSGAKVGVFTYHGCTIRIHGNHETCYVSKETPMLFYMNLHGFFEMERQKGVGPIVMLCGPTDVGKSTLSRILLNYAVRQGHSPLFVDLDLGQGGVSVPGTIGSLMVERTADVEVGFSRAAPLVYHFGDITPSNNTKLYNMLIAELAKRVHERLDQDPLVRKSGVIINTCGWINGAGYRCLLQIAAAFKVNIILAIDQEKLYNELVRDHNSNVHVVFTPKSGGVVVRSRTFRMECRDHQIREYFYGSRSKTSLTSAQLYPHSFDVPFAHLKVYKIGAPAVPASCLPLGMKSDDNLTKLVPVQPSPTLVHHILSVLFSSEPTDVLCRNVQGFVCVTNVDMERQSITLISPQPRPLPSNCVLILSSVQFVDSH
jgi:polyribonucleotide 5'-hydroxyl-kinase